MIERGIPSDKVTRVMHSLARHRSKFVWIEPPTNLGELTVRDVLDADGPEAHLAAVQAWAQSVWRAWTPHHEQARAWLALVS